jgi:hypothetical protein
LKSADNPTSNTCHKVGSQEVSHQKRLLRNVRLVIIWTGTNEIMDLVIQSEFYKEFLARSQKAAMWKQMRRVPSCRMRRFTMWKVK